MYCCLLYSGRLKLESILLHILIKVVTRKEYATKQWMPLLLIIFVFA